ncbi:hypothetical protein J3T78_02530 [Staphylococcus nepalensis]|uniref:Uncharacterized protein n=1 Tax=Staphylococcus nepalensis TaxID=214473 RepID=A0ABS3L3V9_9STAP|nr:MULTISPECIES: hypothetical protein [Staphylococcus]MBO1214122.1 hypothetical protein [Staphylococcus nepalensis]MBO1217385.1 hypothetical protein [Staphylococcus nepalensis]MBO1228195.1 hypothetical protein [Staphylococcus nepalensis]MBO1233727.1 hypothetical protein [Staphylococcus nepalensis]MBO1236584.1 hypothetical protein [Staphylococcus nepalensis]
MAKLKYVMNMPPSFCPACGREFNFDSSKSTNKCSRQSCGTKVEVK